MGNWVNFSAIKSRVRLAQVLCRYGVNWLRRSGPEQYRGRCPIHRGEGPDAFHANLRRDIFHCFACGAGGNVLDFVAAMEGCSIREAALRLMDDTGSGGSDPQGVCRRRKLVTKKRETNRPLGFSLTLDPAHPYLAQRGLSAATISYFGIGYYGGPGLMSGRVAIPIHDRDGQLAAYCGRALDGDWPRYRFPARFQKSQVLFNYHRARAAGEETVIVVEGFFDCMCVHQAGFPAVIALMGARLSPAQRALLVTGFTHVVLLLDGDDTGRTATAEIETDLSRECSVSQLRLAPGVQPDQMSADHIRQFLATSERKALVSP